MNGARKGLFALGAALMIGGSMLAPLNTASAQTMTQCERFMYNWCLSHWQEGWASPGECYADLRQDCGVWGRADLDSPLPYRKEIASA
jgi:hypothetical protein